jgi:hypothetical protein
MKCMVVADCGDKEKVMDVAFLSCEQKTRGGKTYLWYYTKSDARADAGDLFAHGIKCEIKEGWENDGFVTFYI